MHKALVDLCSKHSNQYAVKQAIKKKELLIYAYAVQILIHKKFYVCLLHKN